MLYLSGQLDRCGTIVRLIVVGWDFLVIVGQVS